MKTQYVCQSCGHTQAKWSGQCEGCDEWNTLEEGVAPPKAVGKRGVTAGVAMPVAPATTTRLSAHTAAQYPRFESGSTELDRVLGGGFVPGSMVVLSAEPGAGKALALDTPLPTPTGWTTMGEVEVGDELFDEQGNICLVEDMTETMFDREVYEVVFNDGSSILADGDHQWATLTRKNRRHAPVVRNKLRGVSRHHNKWSAQVGQRQEDGKYTNKYLGLYATEDEAGEVALRARIEMGMAEYTSRETQIFSTTQIKDSLYAGDHLNHAVPVARPLQLPEQELPIHPYVLGAWLGDGNSDSARITTVDESILEAIRQEGHSVKKTAGLYRWHISGLQSLLRKVGILNNKSIPNAYLRAAEHQRRDLLAGLMDTDGGAANRGCGSEFYNSDRSLIDQVYELVVSLGYSASIREKEATCNGKSVGPTWTVTFAAYDQPPFQLQRKSDLIPRGSVRSERRFITEVKRRDSLPVKCVQVSSASHLYLAGESMIPTHNSTLSSRVIDHLAGQGKRVLYMAGEESGAQMRLRCDRMGLTNSDSVDVTDTVELNALAALLEGGYDFCVIDSMQTLYDSNMSAAPGTPSVLKQIGHVLMRIAKGSNVTMLLIGHVTKDGVLAGPRHVEHMVDVVMHMEGDRSQTLRVLRSMKNRFGATDEVGIFEMNEDGLVDVNDPSMLLMNEHSEQVPGSVICPTMEGTRPVFVEVQALAQPVAFQGAPPARRPRGIDKPRLDMLLAVLQRHSRMPLKLHGKDIYVNISNGLRIEETAIDLAVCVAVASAVTGRPVKKDLAVWGEVSLLGEARSIRGDGKRRNEATRLGLTPLAPEPKKRPMPLGVALKAALEQETARTDLSEDEAPLPAPPPLGEDD